MKLYVQVYAPDDGRRNRLKHVERLEINQYTLHLVRCNLELYYDARIYEYIYINEYQNIKSEFFSEDCKIFPTRLTGWFVDGNLFPSN